MSVMKGVHAPLQMRGAECVVMAGDPQQLPPTVLTVTGMECDLDRTAFDRLQVRIAHLLSCPLLLGCTVHGRCWLDDGGSAHGGTLHRHP